jgi:arginyl-tRNA synthetase
MMLTRKSDSQLDFDFARVVEQSRDNPVFYVQYAHARICSVLTKAKEVNHNVAVTGSLRSPAVLARLVREEELALLRLMAQFPRTVEAAAEAHEPHRIAFYLGELAAALHGLWNAGNDDPALRFVMPDDPELTLARAAMITAVRQVLRNGLAVMGVEPIEEM